MAFELSRRRFEHILLIKPSSLGDVIHALPVLHGLRQRYPGARISWLLASSLVDLLRGHPDLDEVIPFDRTRFAALGRSLPVTVEFAAFVRDLRARRFDLVVDLQGLFRSGFLAAASGAGVRIGFADARELGWVFYTHRLPALPFESHAAELNYRIATLLGFPDWPMRCQLHLIPEDHRVARRLLHDAGVRDGERLALLVPGARWETKRWPARKFGELADRLSRDAGYRVVLLGSRAERPLGQAVAAASGSPVIDLIGRTDLRQLMAVIAAADLVVTNDSGTKDIAAAFHRPLVCLYGPTNPRRTGPMLGRGRVVRLEVPCSPCYLKTLAQCPHEHRCLRDLEADAVFGQIAALPGSGSPRSGSPLGKP